MQIKLKPVNCGEILETNLKDPINPKNKMWVEVLRPEKHNKDYQIICYYMMNNSRKIEITLYKNILNNTWGSEIYYFDNKDSLQHYYSKSYKGFVKMPSKYYTIIKYIHPVFIKIFGK